MYEVGEVAGHISLSCAKDCHVSNTVPRALKSELFSAGPETLPSVSHGVLLRSTFGVPQTEALGYVF